MAKRAEESGKAKQAQRERRTAAKEAVARKARERKEKKAAKKNSDGYPTHDSTPISYDRR